MSPEYSNDSFYVSSIKTGRGHPDDKLDFTFYGLQHKEPTPAKTTLTCKVPKNLDDEAFGFWDSRGFIDEYESETRKRYDHDDDDDDDESWKDLVTKNSMAFSSAADTKVSMTPLKPPPRLQYVNEVDYSKSGGQSPAMLSPRTPTSTFKYLFSRRNYWNDDYDPFMVALENVKEEKKSGIWHYSRVRPLPPSCIRPHMDLDDYYNHCPDHHSGPLHKRIYKSTSFRYFSRETKSDEFVGYDNIQSQESDSLHNRLSHSMRFPSFRRDTDSPQEPVEHVLGSPKPKGAAFARHVRLVKMEHEKHRKQATYPFQKVVAEEVGEKETAESDREGNTSKRQKMKLFLKKSLSIVKRGDKDKQTQPGNFRLLSQLSFKSMKSEGSELHGVGSKLAFLDNSPRSDYWTATRSRLSSRLGHSARY